jgi:ribosomal protein L29
MKRQELEQVRQKSAVELRKDLVQARKELVEKRFARFQGSATNVRAIKLAKRHIAQLETLLKTKE